MSTNLVLSYEKGLQLLALDGTRKLTSAQDLFKGLFDLAGYQSCGFVDRLPGRPTPAEIFRQCLLSHDDFLSRVFRVEERGMRATKTQHQLLELIEWYPECFPAGYQVPILLMKDENIPLVSGAEKIQLVIATISRTEKGLFNIIFDSYRPDLALYGYNKELKGHNTIIIDCVEHPIMPHIQLRELEQDLA